MSKFSIKGIFEACRKEIFPTPEEAAKRKEKQNIKELCGDLDLAVRGKRLGELSEQDRNNFMIGFSGLYGVGYMQQPLIDLNDEQKAFHISKISAELLDKGVDQQKIDGIIAHAQDCMDNPKRTWFGYPEDF